MWTLNECLRRETSASPIGHTARALPDNNVPRKSASHKAPSRYYQAAVLQLSIQNSAHTGYLAFHG
jgi:hypothetical protein